MKLYELPLLKQLADLGAFEEKMVRGVFNKQKVGAVNKRLSKTKVAGLNIEDVRQDYIINPKKKRKVVKIGMKENEERNVEVKKIANGFTFTIYGDLFSRKYDDRGQVLGVSLSKAFFSATRSSGSRSLEKNLAKFGGEIREKLLRREREYEAEVKKREVKERVYKDRCKTGC